MCHVGGNNYRNILELYNSSRLCNLYCKLLFISKVVGANKSLKNLSFSLSYCSEQASTELLKSTMAEQVSKSKRPGGQSCVAGALNNKSYTNKQHTEGISLHRFPKDPTVNG